MFDQEYTDLIEQPESGFALLGAHSKRDVSCGNAERRSDYAYGILLDLPYLVADVIRSSKRNSLHLNWYWTAFRILLAVQLSAEAILILAELGKMPIAASAIYFLNLRGDVLINRLYRDDVG